MSNSSQQGFASGALNSTLILSNLLVLLSAPKNLIHVKTLSWLTILDCRERKKKKKTQTLHPDKFCEQYYSESDSITKLTNLSTGSVPLGINILPKEF
jgi:hypothetical protein